jgi:hypothetical protein
MSNARPREIHCSACGEVTLVRAEPVYEGFKKTGEVFVCIACGKRYPSEAETPFVAHEKKPAVFTEADRPKSLSLFADHERQHCCAYCKQMVMNPFGQRCGLTNRFVEATDVCEQFSKK